MPAKAGDRIPSAALYRMTDDGVRPVSTDEIFAGRKVVVFGLPGAFTRVCSFRHLPGFVEKADAIRARGVDEIVCIATNDAFVMDAWGKANQVEGKVTMLADGNSEFTRALDLELDRSETGMGMRSQRYAMIVEDGVIRDIAIDATGTFEASSAEAVLERL
jgi:glutaredoxin/glutathione-dependent peroxiredoxin